MSHRRGLRGRVGTALVPDRRNRRRRTCEQCGRYWRSRFPLCSVCFSDKKHPAKARPMTAEERALYFPADEDNLVIR